MLRTPTFGKFLQIDYNNQILVLVGNEGISLSLHVFNRVKLSFWNKADN